MNDGENDVSDGTRVLGSDLRAVSTSRDNEVK